MIKPQEFSKFLLSFLTAIKSWFVFSYRPLWVALKEIVINEYPVIFRALVPLFNYYSAIGLLFFLMISYRFAVIIESYRALFLISLMVLVMPVIPTMLIPVGLASINTLLAFKLVQALGNFLKPTHAWNTKNFLNSIFSDESILFSGLIIIFSFASKSLFPVIVLGAVQGINLLFKAAHKINEYLTRPKLCPKTVDEPLVSEQEIPDISHTITPINTSEHIERVLDLLKDPNNDYLLTNDNNFYYRHAAEIGRWDIVLQLLKKPNVASNVTCNDCAIISLAIQQDQWDVIKKIIKNPFYTTYPATENKIQTICEIFSKMINQDKMDVINLIVSSGFYKHYSDSSRLAMLFFSIANHDLTAVSILLKSNKLLNLLGYQGFSILFKTMKDDDVKKLFNTNQNLIEHIQNTDWQDATLFNLPVKHLIDKKYLNSLDDCKLFFNNIYEFLNQKLKDGQWVNLFAARFILAKKRYIESKNALTCITVELKPFDEFHDMRFSLLGKYRLMPNMGKEKISLEELIERMCVVYISKLFESEMKKNPKWVIEQKNSVLNCLTHINSANVENVFLTTEHLLGDMSFAENLLKCFVEKELPKIVHKILDRLPHKFSFYSEKEMKEKFKAMTYQITHHFLCMGDNPVFFRVLNNCILNSNCVAEDIHFELDCPFTEGTNEQKLYIILAEKLNEEAKKHQKCLGLEIKQLSEISKICQSLVVSLLKNEEVITHLQALKNIIIDIDKNEVEKLLISEAIKIIQDNHSVFITHQFNAMQDSNTAETIVPPVVNNRHKGEHLRIP